MALTIKASLGENIHRLRLKTDEDLTIDKLKEALREAFGLPMDEPPSSLVIKYKDEDGDLCLLTAHSIDDALIIAQGGTADAGGTLRLWLTRTAPLAPSPAAPVPPAPASPAPTSLAAPAEAPSAPTATQPVTPIDITHFGDLQGSNEFTRFYDALKSGDVEERDGVVALPEGVEWPGMDSSKLLVRHFYHDLWEHVLDKGRGKGLGKVRGATILGTPGIGKSAFGLYALFRAFKEGRPVVYHRRKGRSLLLSRGALRVFGEKSAIADLPELDNPNALYICDSLPPIGDGDIRAFTLLITSPKKENWSEFFKSANVHRLVLPVYSHDEIEQLRALDFEGRPGCTREEVTQRFFKWGGSPRSVLTMATSLEWQVDLDTCGQALSLPALLTAMKSQNSLAGIGHGNALHRVLDLVPRGSLPDIFPGLTPDQPKYYSFHHAELLSAHLGGLFAKQLLKEEAVALHSFLHLASSDPSSASLRGVLYERAVVLPRLLNGKGASLELKRLSDTTPHWISPPSLLSNSAFDVPATLKCVFFQCVNDLSAKWQETQGDAIFVPYSKNFPVVDLVLRINGTVLLANATVAATHGVKIQNPLFLELLKVVGLQPESKSGSEIPLVWVLPRDAFDAFTKPGPLTDRRGCSLASGSSARTPVGARLAQYKLLLEVPSAEIKQKHTTVQHLLSGAREEEDEEGGVKSRGDDTIGGVAVTKDQKVEGGLDVQRKAEGEETPAHTVTHE